MNVIVTKKQIAEAAGKAALSSHVYFRDKSAPPPAGWHVVATSDELMPGKRSFFGALYAKDDPDNGKTDYTVAFRGTDGNDLKSNFMIAIGRLPPQFKDAVTFTKLAAEKAGVETKDLSVTGHSLGGYLARTVGRVIDVKKVWAFASPGPSKETRDYLEKIAPSALPNDKIIHIRSRHDIIGLLGTEENIVLELNTSERHHAINKIQNHLSQLLGGPNAAQVPAHARTRLLERVFNAVSKPLASGVHLYNSIKKLAVYKTQPRLGFALMPRGLGSR